MVTPKLRFKEFDSAWSNSKIDDIAVVTSGGTPSRSNLTFWDGNIPWVTTSLVDFNIIQSAEEFITQKGLDNSSAKLFPKNTILMAMYGQGITRGKVAILGIDATTNQACAAIKLQSNYDTQFIFQNLMNRYEEIRDLSNDGGQKNLSAGIIKEIEVNYPEKTEQTKIATFLSAVDEKIAQLSQKLHLLGQYKQGMMQKLFYQQIRFKADDGSEFGEWEIQPLNHYLYTSKLKNKDLTYTTYDVLSVSGEFGIVNQINLLGRSYAGVSVAPYGIVEVNDVVYTKSPLKSNPYGIIKVNQGKAGIVSTLYAVYKCKENIIPKLIEYYFQNDSKLNQLLKPLVKKGAKNDMKVNNDHVLTGKISFPASLEEQTKIANFLSAIDQKIDVVSEQLKQAKIWKKGLLQQMFV